jgi:mitochondrial import inner membrane translocase subunit TIM23
MSDDYLNKPLSFDSTPGNYGLLARAVSDGDVIVSKLYGLFLAAPPQRLAALSPYLNYDPRYLQSQPEFIFPEGASKQRGRFELAFSQIGSSVMVGAAIG